MRQRAQSMQRPGAAAVAATAMSSSGRPTTRWPSAATGVPFRHLWILVVPPVGLLWVIGPRLIRLDGHEVCVNLALYIGC
jgi:hypothetical protein